MFTIKRSARPPRACKKERHAPEPAATKRAKTEAGPHWRGVWCDGVWVGMRVWIDDWTLSPVAYAQKEMEGMWKPIVARIPNELRRYRPQANAAPLDDVVAMAHFFGKTPEWDNKHFVKGARLTNEVLAGYFARKFIEYAYWYQALHHGKVCEIELEL